MNLKYPTKINKKRIEKIIYPTPTYNGRPYIIGAGNHFFPIVDDTDHFHWACSKCKIVSDILMVKRSDGYASEPTIYFVMRCPKCGGEGQRKIYIESKKCRFERGYDSGKMHFFNDKGEQIKEINLKSDESSRIISNNQTKSTQEETQ